MSFDCVTEGDINDTCFEILDDPRGSKGFSALSFWTGLSEHLHLCAGIELYAILLVNDFKFSWDATHDSMGRLAIED